MEFNKPTEEMIEKLKEVIPGRVYTGADISEDYTHDDLTRSTQKAENWKA